MNTSQSESGGIPLNFCPCCGFAVGALQRLATVQTAVASHVARAANGTRPVRVKKEEAKVAAQEIVRALPTKKRRKAVSVRPISDDEIERFAKLAEQGKTMTQIAALLGRPAGTISYIKYDRLPRYLKEKKRKEAPASV